MFTERSATILFVAIAALATLASTALPRVDFGPASQQTASLPEQDRDRDGIPDLFDLCPGEPNTGLPDRDGDGTRDQCDLAPNGDGLMRVVFDGQVWYMGARAD